MANSRGMYRFKNLAVTIQTQCYNRDFQRASHFVASGLSSSSHSFSISQQGNGPLATKPRACLPAKLKVVMDRWPKKTSFSYWVYISFLQTNIPHF